jgi:hypothetical protein
MQTLFIRIAGAAARGFATGVLATTTMSTAMLGFQKVGLMGHMPPRKITEHFLGMVGLRRWTSRRTRRALSTVAHFAFGGVAAALFEAGREIASIRRGEPARPPTPPPLAASLAYATGVWAVSYLGWVPSLGIMAPPSKDRFGRPTSMVIAHWIYGATLAAASP